MNQFGDERKQNLSDYYPADLNTLFGRIEREVRPIVLGVTYWNCFHPWNVPVRRICDHFFLFPESGAERVSVNGETRILHRGEGMIVPEFEPHSFGLAEGCVASSHFIAHALTENVARANPFAGFVSPFVRLRHPDSTLHELKRISAMRSLNPDAALSRMASLLRTLMLDEAEAGRFSLEPVRGNDDRISPVLKFIRENFSSNIGVGDLAERAQLGTVRFRSLFEQTVGMTPAAYLLRYRLIHAARLLTRYNQSIAEVAEASGFSSDAYFCTAFRKAFGRSPGDYRKHMRLCL